MRRHARALCAAAVAGTDGWLTTYSGRSSAQRPPPSMPQPRLRLGSLSRRPAQMDARVESRLGRLARAEGGLIACITGANAGIGLELATRLAVCGVHVVMLCRSEKRGKEAVAVVRSACLAETGMAPAAPVQLVQCDVSEPAAVRACAAALAAALPRIDLLYLNAGTMPVEGYNWASLIRAATTDQPLLGGPPEGGITHFFETGRGSATGEHFLVNPRWAREPSADHAGAPHLLATHVLGHVLLVELCAKNGLIGRGRVPELGADSKVSGGHARGDTGGRTARLSPRLLAPACLGASLPRRADVAGHGRSCACLA